MDNDYAEILDEILRHVNSNENGLSYNLSDEGMEYAFLYSLTTKIYDLKQIEFGLMIKFLHEEKMLVDDETKQKIFPIFKGFHWLKIGGYTGENARVSAESRRMEILENHQMESETKLNRLTLVLAIGSIGLLLFEILKAFYHIYLSCDCV